MERKVGQLTATALESVRYDVQTGLVPVVVQDQATGVVLMLAYANREALKRTLGTGQAWFWSRSRGDYWPRGLRAETFSAWSKFAWTAMETPYCIWWIQPDRLAIPESTAVFISALNTKGRLRKRRGRLTKP